VEFYSRAQNGNKLEEDKLSAAKWCVKKKLFEQIKQLWASFWTSKAFMQDGVPAC
jgi:hypothetical protein